MPKFTILAEATIPYTAVVEASSQNEAYKIGLDMSKDQFEEQYPDFYVYDAEPYEE